MYVNKLPKNHHTAKFYITFFFQYSSTCKTINYTMDVIDRTQQWNQRDIKAV